MADTCTHCGAALAHGQEYCVECGIRLPGPGRLGPPPASSRRTLVAVTGLLLVAMAAAAVAVAATWEPSTAEEVLTATGGSVRPAPTPGEGLVAWPVARSGWTIVLASIPKKEGRAAALARANEARTRGLTRVGVLDSSRVSSLHPGYWVVFSGVYDTRPEATSALQRARSVSRTAVTRRVVVT